MLQIIGAKEKNSLKRSAVEAEVRSNVFNK
jgi:hypothetical protein